MKMRAIGLSLAVVLCWWTSAFGLGEEEIGNGPVSAANYTQWDGLVHVINDSHRVYRNWVNGNEHFVFQGDNVALNSALEEFAKVQAKPLEVVLRSGPARTTTFDASQSFDYNWSLQVIGGIAASLSKRDQGAHVWPTHPILTVYIGGPIQLSQLTIPEAVSVIGTKELRERYKLGLKSTHQDIRGWTCGKLVELDPYDSDAFAAVVAMLQDESDWVQSNAISAIGNFGSSLSTSAIPALQALGDTGSDDLKTQITETVNKIQQGGTDARESQNQQQISQAIEKYLEQRTPQK